MSKHRVDLVADKKRQTQVDPRTARDVVDGKITLAEGLALGKETLDGLRRQALALCETGKFQACVDIMAGIAALGDVHPADAVLLARAFRGLGNHEAAYHAEEHARLLGYTMGVDLHGLFGSEEHA